ncbi:MAG TPA: DNA/RNA non-specific endonuclease [Gemmatimonadaceae bacterium]|nr:DNA/RNA non-specific endonuclease [Gemmatimonadaceae bacterium]
MRFLPARTALALFVGASVLSCKDSLTSVRMPLTPKALNADVSAAVVVAPTIVISQIYGGGGNANTKYKNDFIELFNPGNQAVSLTGWSVQYASASATGAFNQFTLLTGSIPAGGYYLVKEAAGSGGTDTLPAPNATGSIAMALGAGKVLLAQSTSALGGNCPKSGYVDLVTYGAVSGMDCGSSAPGLSNATAAFRGDNGCTYTGNDSLDFTAAAPAPRNSATPPHFCPGQVPLGPLDHVSIAGATILVAGSSVQLTAAAQDANNQIIPTATFTWATSDENVATVDAKTGKVTGVAASTNAVTITATTVDGDITKTGTFQITITDGFIDLSSSSNSFPPGFQTQLFPTARTGPGGAVIPATFTFEAVDPTLATVATVQNTGIVTGVAAPADGTTRPGIRITAIPLDDGKPFSFVTHSINIEAPISAPATIYAVNDEFGDPTAASPSDPTDLLIRRNQYTLSYNESRGTPNWVSYELDSRQMATGQDRCNCFSADPLLPVDKQILTADYTNGGFDRGHMTRSADRTAGNVDNAMTFYLTNVVPQQADLNQGVWAQFENALADSAKHGRAVYIITGPLYSQPLKFLKNEGKVAIPDSTWKIALIGPGNGGNPFTRANVQSWDDLAGLTILAVNMPNVSGVRNDPWAKYLTTVDKIEQSTGYDFLSKLQTAFQHALEAGDHAPIPQFDVLGIPNEITPVTLDASPSTDPDIGRAGFTDALTSYAWTFSDGATSSDRTVTHTFTRFGTYTATLTVTDSYGWQSASTKTITVNDIPPTVSAIAGASLIAGERYTATGSFADPGLDLWSATVDYGDGAGPQPLTLDGKGFSLSHVYSSARTFTVTVTVNDGGAYGSSAATVTVISPYAATQNLAGQVQILAAGGSIAEPQVQPILASINAAAKQIQRGDNMPAINELGALINKINASVISGRMSTDAARQLTDMVRRIQNVLGG